MLTSNGFFKSIVVTVLLYRLNALTLTKILPGKLDRTYTKMLKAVTKISLQEHITNKELNARLLKLLSLKKSCTDGDISGEVTMRLYKR